MWSFYGVVRFVIMVTVTVKVFLWSYEVSVHHPTNLTYIQAVHSPLQPSSRTTTRSATTTTQSRFFYRVENEYKRIVSCSWRMKPSSGQSFKKTLYKWVSIAVGVAPECVVYIVLFFLVLYCIVCRRFASAPTNPSI